MIYRLGLMKLKTYEQGKWGVSEGEVSPAKKEFLDRFHKTIKVGKGRNIANAVRNVLNPGFFKGDIVTRRDHGVELIGVVTDVKKFPPNTLLPRATVHSYSNYTGGVLANNTIVCEDSKNIVLLNQLSFPGKNTIAMFEEAINNPKSILKVNRETIS